MRLPLVAAALALVACAPPAFAQLSAKRVVEVLPGTWVWGPTASPFGYETVKPGTCGKDDQKIWFERIDGKLYFLFSVPQQARPVVRGKATVELVNLTDKPNGPGAIRIHYEDETRLTRDGKEVEWLLIMPDKDRFFWVRSDWKLTQHTAVNVRCNSASTS